MMLQLRPVLLALVVAVGPTVAPVAGQEHAHGAQPATGIRLYDDLGDLHHEITTAVPLAQQFFDQGLRLTYAFNHAEAIASYRRAAELDTTCAMCWWGIAWASGPNINLPMDSASGAVAYHAMQQAIRLSGHASPKHQGFIRALATRYAAATEADRKRLDTAYARAMGDLASRYPDDPEAQALHAEALMLLSPWNYWTGGKEPRPGTETLLRRLTTVIERAPEHPGACHFYIHAVEAAYPERAVACAERLAALMPGAGHIVHMPGHIYIRVGRYMDAIRANEHAVHADETWIQDRRPGVGVYTAGYYPHNYDFMAFAASMAGRSAQAIEAAERVAALVPDEMLRTPGMTFLQQFITRPLQFRVRFGRWQEILAAPAPPEDLPHARALWHYARGRALAAGGDSHAAEAELARLREVIAHAALQDVSLEFNPPTTILRIAAGVLAGNIAAARGDFAGAVTHLEEAARLEDGLTYGEPPEWSVPVRHELGAFLLAAGRPAEAEAAYREDLDRFPRNGWSLLGLTQALRAQGRTGEAARTEREFRNAWSDADVSLAASKL